MASRLYRIGFRAAPAVEEVWRSFASLADGDCRKAFFRTLRAVVDVRGQAVTATDRLYLTSQVPALIVWGAEDPFIPVAHAVDAHAAMPGSRLEIFEGVGHFPHCEVPDRFVAVLVDFIASTAPAQLSASRWRELLQSHPPLSAGTRARGTEDRHAPAA
jgi:pimeloyl-ACP methyl ester carboxylesterase